MKKYNTFILVKESIKTARANYLDSGQVTQNEFDEFVAMDPSKTFKYVDALLGFYINGHIDDINTLKTDIKNFHSLSERGLISKKDINALEYLEFKSEILDAQSKLKVKEIKKNQESDVLIIKDDEKFLIVVPNTYEASCKYGQGTKWCTSSKNEPWHFSNYRYLNKVTLYYIHNKRLPETNPMYKTSVVVDRWNDIYECYDARDELIFIDDILKMGINKSIFKYIPPKLPKDIIEAYEIIGNAPHRRARYVKILKPILNTSINDDSSNIYLVNNEGKLDVLIISNNNTRKELVGWYSKNPNMLDIWKSAYDKYAEDIIDYSKNYKISDELSKIIQGY